MLTYKQAENLMVTLGLPGIVLLVAAFIIKNVWAAGVGVVLCLLSAAAWRIFGRCPHCGKFVGFRDDGKVCRKCGGSLTDIPEELLKRRGKR